MRALVSILFGIFLTISSVKAVTPSVSTEELAAVIGERTSKVAEFKYIQEQAKRLGVRAWLFGGSAASFAHYVKWDLQRDRGDSRYQPDRFDYDYTNIYRSTQDMDIVIDGHPEKALELQKLMAQEFPHLQGSKSVWEVRLLRQSMGDKQALLDNPDFLNQHTDSNSTGMIELTRGAAGEPAVKDLRDWDAKTPNFLKDVAEGKLHFYFSPQHETTKFFKEGRNPAILSVIRYLTKAFQFELDLRPEDLDQIRKIIDGFDSKSARTNSYVSNWLLHKDNGRKIFQAAVNLEYAWDTLEKLGLRKKLIAIENNPDVIDSLAWWMNKEPLRTRPIGTGTGKTARELGLDMVAHEAKNYLALESITKAHTGNPNVFVSRPNVNGEKAAYDWGFYTMSGEKGGAGTGQTIRFRLDPDAREGTDFLYFGKDGDPKRPAIVLVRNKAAMKVIPESLRLDPLQYFTLLANDGSFRESDKGMVEKLRRRVRQGLSAGAMSKDEIRKIFEVVKSHPGNWLLLSEWLSTNAGSQFPEWSAELDEGFEALIRNHTDDEMIIKTVLTHPHWSKRRDWLKVILDYKTTTSPGAFDWDAEKRIEWSVKHLFSRPEWLNRESLQLVLEAQRRISSSKQVPELHMSLFSDPRWRGVAEDAVFEILKNQYAPGWLSTSRGVEGESYHNNFGAYESMLKKALENFPHLTERFEKERVAAAIDRIANPTDLTFLKTPYWRNHPSYRSLMDQVLDRGIEKNQPEMIFHAVDSDLVRHHPEAALRLMKNFPLPQDGFASRSLSGILLQSRDIALHPEVLQWAIDHHEITLKNAVGFIDIFVKNPVLYHFPRLMESLVRRIPEDQDLFKRLDEILSRPPWSQVSAWRAASGGAVPTTLGLRKAFASGLSSELRGASLMEQGHAGHCVIQSLRVSFQPYGK